VVCYCTFHYFVTANRSSSRNSSRKQQRLSIEFIFLSTRKRPACFHITSEAQLTAYLNSDQDISQTIASRSCNSTPPANRQKLTLISQTRRRSRRLGTYSATDCKKVQLQQQQQIVIVRQYANTTSS
jgi:hypothetical protein